MTLHFFISEAGTGKGKFGIADNRTAADVRFSENVSAVPVPRNCTGVGFHLFAGNVGISVAETRMGGQPSDERRGDLPGKALHEPKAGGEAAKDLLRATSGRTRAPKGVWGIPPHRRNNKCKHSIFIKQNILNQRNPLKRISR